MISGIIFQALRGLVSDRVYPSAFPQPSITGPGTTIPNVPSPPWPAIRYTQISAFNEAAVCGTTGFDDDDSDWQIDVVAKTYGAMTALAADVDAQFRAMADPPAVRTGYFETKDTATQTHRGILTYTVHASSGHGSPY